MRDEQQIERHAHSWFSPRRVKQRILHAKYENIEEYEKDLDSAIAYIASLKDNNDIRDFAINNINCKHEEYKGATYTVQKRIMGYATVYERVCKNCGHTDIWSNYEGEKDGQEPEWTIGAKRQYYNNFI